MTHRLVDADERYLANPISFYVPPYEWRTSLKPDDLVKVIFEVDGVPGVRGERMWVKITEAKAGRYKGTLNNQPVVLKDQLKLGDEIEFGPANICNIQRVAMTRDELNVTVEGVIMSGRSTVAVLISKVLKECGAEVVIMDSDGVRIDQIPVAADILDGKKVTINIKQVPRGT